MSETDPVSKRVTDEGGLSSGMGGRADNTSARS